MNQTFPNLLESLHDIEVQIANYIKNEGLRFSINKTTADIGEYYVYKMLSKRCDLIELTEIKLKATADFDFLGRITVSSELYKFFKKEEIRIEVKTRRNQKGLKYLSGVKPEKFDLLCMVDLHLNYRLNKIHLITSDKALEELDHKYNRLIFQESYAFMSL